MKKLLSLFLSLCIMGTMLVGITLPAAATSSDEKITYEDLFYKYPHYLTVNVHLTSLAANTTSTTTNILNEYITTGHFYTSVIVHGVDVATDASKLIKYISDNVGDTNFQLNDELDSANQKFVEAVCNVELTAANSSTRENKYTKAFNTLASTVKKVDQAVIEDEAHYKTLKKPELYKYFIDRAFAVLTEQCTQLRPKLPSLKAELYTVLSETTEILGVLTDAVDFTKALALSILMQEAQIDLIQEIIDTQSTDSTLYKGMTRLKNQLKDGFLSYFTTTYIEDEVYKQIISTVNKEIGSWALGRLTTYTAATLAIVKVLNNLVFKTILGFDYHEYSSAVMLNEYARDLYLSVRNKADSFKLGFADSDIEKFEALYNAFIAMKAAAYEECKNIAKHNKTFDLEYAESCAQYFDKENAYKEYLDGVIEFVLAMPEEHREIADRTVGWKYTVADGEITITGHESPYGALIIPSEIDGLPVTSIGDGAFSGCKNIVGINIPNSVKNIGNHSFNNCTNLAEIVIPDSVTNIGLSAFYNCSSLKRVSIPDSVVNIDNYAFLACSSITNVILGNGLTAINHRVFYECRNLKSINIPNSVKHIGSDAFYNCSNLKSIVIPDSVTTIDKAAFKNCVKLTDTVIGNGISLLSDSVFANCTSLVNVDLGDNVKEIGDYAFRDCTNLENINLHSNVGKISYMSFGYCKKLANITIPDSVMHIDDNAFYYCNSITNIIIPNSVTSIGDSAFGQCESLETVTIGSGLETMRGNPFSYCKNISSIKVGPQNTKYDSRNNCNAIIETDTNTLISGCKETDVPKNVVSINTSAFSGCYNLTSITIPDSVTSIGSSAFSHCDSLASITIPDSVTSIGSSAFSHCDSLTSITFPDGVTSIEQYAFYDCDSLTNVSIPGGVASIGSGAFSYCDNLTSITILDGVTSIGDYTFAYCNNLASITISNTVTSIGSGAFSGCENLSAVHIKDLAFWCNISFKDWYSNPLYYAHNLYVDGNKVKRLNIPDGVTSIKKSAFCSCDSFANVTIPNSVTSIEQYAFYDCDSLTSITFPDSVTSIEQSAFFACDSLEYITIPDVAISIGYCAFLATAYSDNFNNWINGVLYIGNHLIEAKDALAGDYVVKDGTMTVADLAFSYCENITSIYLPESIKSIGEAAFYHCENLANINIPSGVEYINHSTFCECQSLTSINIPNSVKRIDVQAFYNCKSLKNVVMGDNVKQIGYEAFENCKSLEKVKMSENIEIIENSAFHNCYKLLYINLPNSIKEIRRIAFYYSGVKNVYYDGTAEEWEESAIYWDAFSSTTDIHYNHGIDHSYTSTTITPPTTTKQGYTTYTCSCGDSYTGNYTAAIGTSVQNMQIVATDTNITITWDAVEGTTKNILYVKNKLGETLITRELAADRTSVTLSWPNELEWDKNYTIGIRAKTTRWLDTVYKDAALVVGNRIVDVKAESVGRTIKVNWRAYEDATQYYVYVYKRGAYSEGAITSVKATTNSATIINAINPEIDYEVRVIATKGVPKMATADALSINARLNVFTPDTFTERGITPTKVGIGFDEVRGADKYWVYLTPVGGGAEIIKESTKAIAAVANLAPNTTYTVQIQARITDADGKTHYSGKSAVLGTITTNDWEDVNFTATATGNGAQLSWNVPTNAYSYIIYRSTNGGKSYKKFATISDPAQASYIDAKAKSGYKYAIVTQIQDDFVTAKSPLFKSEAIVK